MKNSEIHKGLDKKEVRDFLSKQMADSSLPWKEPEGQINSSDPIEWGIERAKIAIGFGNFQLKNLEIRKAIIILINKMGWEEFDVSEYVILEGNRYLHFIGTKEEHEKIYLK